MTPKEYAKELYLKFHFAIPAIADEWQEGQNSAKECALIALDEIYKNNTDMKKNDYFCRVAKELNKL